MEEREDKRIFGVVLTFMKMRVDIVARRPPFLPATIIGSAGQDLGWPNFG